MALKISLQEFNYDMNIIAKLDDEPNDVGGLTAAQLKAKFDEGGVALQNYLNSVLLPLLETLGVESITRSGDGVSYLRLNEDNVLEVSTDGVNFYATGSSGHLILDKNNVFLPQRSRLKFDNCEVSDDGVNTVVHGVQGEKGDKGDKGDTGDVGPVGAVGPVGPVIVPSIDPDTGVMSFTIQDTAIAPQSISVRGPQGPQGVQGAQGLQGVAGPQGIQGVQGFQGQKGDKGEDGSSFSVKGMYETLNDLIAAHPVGNDGDAYIVGSENTNVVYIWDVDAVGWVNVGPIQGPQGPQGPQGVQGVQGVQGPAGVAGTDGKSAYQAAVEGGYEGTEAGLNAALAAVPDHINDTTKHITAAERTKWDAMLPAAQKGAPDGVAELDATGKVPAAQLPATMTPAAHAESHKTGGSDPLTYADIGAAPANLSSFAFTVTSEAELETALDELVAGMSAAFHIAFGRVTYTGGNPFGATSWFARVSNYYGDAVVDFYNYRVTGPAANLAVKRRIGGVWHPLEYTNPPMALGVEYRTTERYNGKPVYVKTVSTGALPAAGGHANRTTTDSGVVNATAIVRTRVVISDAVDPGNYHFLPAVDFDNTVMAHGYARLGNGYVGYFLQTSKDLSNYSGAWTVWYTKD